MDNREPIVTVDLTRCRTLRVPEYEYSKMVYRVIGRDTPDDIYRILKIDEKFFTIFVDSRRLFSGFDNRRDLSFVFRDGMDLYIYVKKNASRDSYSGFALAGSIHVSIPSATYGAESFEFKNSSAYTATSTLTLSVGNSRPRIYISCDLAIAESVFGLSFDELGVECIGAVLDVAVPERLYRRYETDLVNFSLHTLFDLKGNVQKESNVRYLMLLLKNREGMTGVRVLPSQGIKKVLDQMLPFYRKLLEGNELYLLAAFQTLVFESKKTITGVKVAKFFNESFAPVQDMAAFRAKLQEIYEVFARVESGRGEYDYYRFEELFVKFPGYAPLRKQALQAHSGRALAKFFQDVDSVQCDREEYPILAALIEDGSIPVSTFFRKEGDETYFLFNDNWPLFEEFLSRYRDVGIRLAKLASQRTTYEKSFMSYLYFLLYGLPEYLEKHTGKRWTCIPSIVESAHELEPERTQSGQTTKQRSALTPAVNNETCTVVVPYACLKVPGISTTYTYSLNYSTVHRGLSIEGAVSLLDIEAKLNGRDDYGLMFYTLTGSAVGRGYPTFLIIFERLDGDETRVHFHRPVNNWIRTCYNWMVGNINLSRIKAQQGDLVFVVSVDSLPDGERTLVNSYDSHTFSGPVSFSPCTKKDSGNILGYLELREDVHLTHPEHRKRIIPAGLYELRQCRSWEANPKGVWSLRID
jgi:hypothetical protein